MKFAKAAIPPFLIGWFSLLISDDAHFFGHHSLPKICLCMLFTRCSTVQINGLTD